jgi:cell division transport system ATP-binding protein
MIRDKHALIEFDKVGLRYGHGPEILKDLSFAIEPGSFHFLTGPSGAGKTSLLRLLLLSLKASRGRMRMFGKDVTNVSGDRLLELRRHIGIVFQEFRLLDHLTTFENVALPLAVRGQPEKDYRANVEELLEWVGLGDRMNVAPALLSGGEKQRAAIARAVIAKPDLLLADEPTGNVDPDLSERLLRLFVELNRMGTTIIVATHELSLLKRFHYPRMSLSDGTLAING